MRDVVGTLKSIVSRAEVQVAWGSHLWLASEMGAVLWD